MTCYKIHTLTPVIINKSAFFQITKWFTTLKLVLLLQAPLLVLQWHTKTMKTIVETQGLNLKPKMATALGKNHPIQSNLSKGIDNCLGVTLLFNQIEP